MRFLIFIQIRTFFITKMLKKCMSYFRFQIKPHYLLQYKEMRKRAIIFVLEYECEMNEYK